MCQYFSSLLDECRSCRILENGVGSDISGVGVIDFSGVAEAISGALRVGGVKRPLCLLDPPMESASPHALCIGV